MEAAQSEIQNKMIILESGEQYFYTVKPVEITNALGVVIATLQEYIFTDNNAEIYKLYKTKEENWYDVPETITAGNATVLWALKCAIDINILKEVRTKKGL